MSEVILLKTHLINKQFENLFYELSENFEVYVLYDKPIDKEKFIYTDISKLNNYPMSKGVNYWYYNNYSLMYFYKFFEKKYDYYWFIEHDVKYSGDWCDFIKNNLIT